MIKAIETMYNGYRFRSRLEARWAVFFDAMGIEYEYEKEGYDLGEAGLYLPDFWLPQFSLWVEVKPFEGIAASDHACLDKLRALREITGCPVVLCQGYPKKVWNYLLAYDMTDSGGGDYECYSTFATDSRGLPYVITQDSHTSRSICNSEYIPMERIKTMYSLAELEQQRSIEVKMDYIDEEEFCVFDITLRNTLSCQAALRARQARFEHGENGM